MLVIGLVDLTIKQALGEGDRLNNRSGKCLKFKTTYMTLEDLS